MLGAKRIWNEAIRKGLNLPYFTEKKKMLMHIYYINFYNFFYTSLVVLGVIQKPNKKFKIVEIINAL